MTTSTHLKFYCYFFFLALLVVASASTEAPPAPHAVQSPLWDDGGFDDSSDYPAQPPTAPCNPDDKNILFQIKEEFNNSDIFNSWVPDTDCCNSWNFVGCDFATGRVNIFNFFGNHPWGSNGLPSIFPPIIGNLTYLATLRYKNNYTGRIPASLANLKNLGFLDLADNRLHGPIPRFLGTFINLASLDLGNNQLSGSIPVQLSQLPNLNFISISNNRLKGRIPGTLFSQLKGSLNKDVYVSLDSNKLTGTIPKSFSNINFNRLDLHNNKLKGDASFLFGKNKPYWYLDLSNNKLSFNMTNLEVDPDIMTLYLNNNKLFGRLNTSLIAARLFYFNVSKNHLCGQIPVGGKLQGFGASPYSGNKCLCGAPLPPCA